MKRFLFAAALAALLATGTSADDKPAAAATPAPAATAAPAIEMAPATTSGTRRGLFARLRERRAGTTMSAPVMATPTVTAPPATAPMPMPGTTVPTPMPGKTSGTTVTPAGGTASMTGEIVTAGYSEPAQTRRGLFARMRNR